MVFPSRLTYHPVPRRAPITASISRVGPAGAPARPIMRPGARSSRMLPRTTVKTASSTLAVIAEGAGTDSTAADWPIAAMMSASVSVASGARHTTLTPSRRTVQTAAICRISRIRCETNTMAIPRSTAKRRNTENSRSVSAAVKLAVGSSNSRIWAPALSARAISTSWRS